MTINPGGNTTNTGTFQVNSGSTLVMRGALTNYNSGTSTLTGGTYNAFSGTMKLVATGNVIATNAATILLDGAAAKITDLSGNNALNGHFATNAAAGNFTIQNGANLTSAASDFTNAGHMTVGNGSTFTVGGGNNFLNSGTLEGSGTVVANTLINSGVVAPDPRHPRHPYDYWQLRPSFQRPARHSDRRRDSRHRVLSIGCLWYGNARRHSRSVPDQWIPALQW